MAYSSLSDKALKREIVEAAKVLARDSELLAERGVDAWGDPKLRWYVKRVLAARRALRRVPEVEQMTLLGYEADEAEQELLPKHATSGAEHELYKLKAAVRRGVAQKLYPVGNTIADTWTDLAEGVAYEAPWVVVSHREVRLANGETRPGVVLLRQITTPFRVEFDTADAVYAYGSNCLELSALLAWLNSSAKGPDWWHAQHAKDAEPAYAREKAGYLAGCSAVLQEVAAEIMLDATVMGEAGAEHGRVKCKMFPPSLEELNVDATGRNSLYPGRAWEYFRDAPQHPDAYCPERVFRDEKGEARRCWTRTPKLERDSYLWMITPDGDADVSNAGAKYAVVVTCAVG